MPHKNPTLGPLSQKIKCIAEVLIAFHINGYRDNPKQVLVIHSKLAIRSQLTQYKIGIGYNIEMKISK
jgi:hypothetical protein